MEGFEMNFFFNKVKDERVVHAQNKIYRELYLLVLFVCLVSVAVKFYMYGNHIENVYTELIILLAQGIYFSYRSAATGLFTDEVELHDRSSKWSLQKKSLFFGLTAGFIIALFFGVRSAILYGDGGLNSFYTFCIVFFVSIIIYVPFLVFVLVISYEMMKRKSDTIMNKQLGEENNEKY